MTNQYRLCPTCGSTVFQDAPLGERRDFHILLSREAEPLEGGPPFTPPNPIYCRDCAWSGSVDQLDILL